ncbi:hypothetical protein SLEP1_g56396 [Rubroshorea leprosula]|uniref:Uncharacterized protein n=1 Tax=Rubroshorea leprosula TaxID=152421 RepID=A0AAV5MM39_9ROSI|nr:hypothetical protein SLEP1_g56396 [Rubroshorea leprosula]
MPASNTDGMIIHHRFSSMRKIAEQNAIIIAARETNKVESPAINFLGIDLWQSSIL